MNTMIGQRMTSWPREYPCLKIPRLVVSALPPGLRKYYPKGLDSQALHRRPGVDPVLEKASLSPGMHDRFRALVKLTQHCQPPPDWWVHPLEAAPLVVFSLPPAPRYVDPVCVEGTERNVS